MGKFQLLSTLLLPFCGAQNPCEAEISSACPDRPASELASCLKDTSEHETATDISSDCTDFIALNVACAEDIVKFCDEAFFSPDTTLCLGEWTAEADLSPKCAKVVKWAVPKKPEAESDGPVDELGMTEKERREKAEWQAKRRAGRSAAVEKLKEDRQAEKELEELKREDPAAYAQLMKEREEARRSVEELKKRKRLMAAAEERKRREEMGEEPEETEEERKERLKQERYQARRAVSKKTGRDWLPLVLGGLFVAWVIFNVMNYVSSRKQKKSDEDKDD